MERFRKRLLILVIVDILVSTAILLGTSFLQSENIFSKRMEEQAQLQADAYAQELGGWMNGYVSVVEAIASEMSQSRVADRSSGEILEYLRNNLININKDNEIADLYYTDVKYHMICGSEHGDQGILDYVKDREWYINASAGDELYYSSPYMDALESRSVITLSKAVREGSELKGVLCADIYVDTLIDKINQSDFENGTYAFLVDSSYRMVVHPCADFKYTDEPVSITSSKSVDYSELKEHLEKHGRDVHFITDYDDVNRGFVTAVIPGMNWYVGIATPRSELVRDIRTMIITFLAAGMASLLIGVIILVLFTSRLVKDRQVRSTEAFRRFGLKNILISFAAVLFFVVLIVVYVSMLYNSSKETIVAKGELHSVESANSLNKYISQGTDIVRQAKYELDKMLDAGCKPEDIKAYVVDDTEMIKATLDQNYTGIYAYINGRYYDGANWVPDSDWVATERPWYKKAVAADGKLALVEPYIDAQTGLTAMTVAMAMNDRKNVVAIDVVFSMMETVTEDAGIGSDKVEMVLDANGNVIAHSDGSEIGKNYLEETNTLGAAVAEKLYSSKDQCFELKYGDVNYVVYSVNMNNEWYSLTLIDSKESYRPLSILVIASVFVILITVTILLLIFINISTKSMAVEKLNQQLSATSDIYLTAYDIDLIHDTYSMLHESQRLSEYLKDAEDSAGKTLYETTGTFTMSDTRDAILEFINLDTLNKRMKDTNTIAMEFHAKDGRWLRGRFIVSERTPDGNISHVLWLVESVDEEKKQRDRLQDMSARAIAESEAKSSFLSNMSHEIRTPITAVLGMNEMVLRECDDDNILNYAESIETAGRTLLGIVNDILDFSKIEAGKMEIIPVEYDLSSVLNDLVNMTQIRIEEKGLVLNLDFSHDLPSILYGDEVRIKQIITNILTNAVKYTEKGKVTFSVWFETEERDPDHILLIAEVRDTGIGIRKEAMEKLFSRFDRIEEKRNRNIEGTGLGMTITKRLLELMNGTIDVKSIYGKGSTFRVSIRQKVVDWKKIGNYEEAFRQHVQRKDRYQQSFSAPDAKVLIVDDTQMNLMVFKSLLKSTEVQIDTAKNGDEGLVLMWHKPYDVIFLDHMMPIKDGIQTLRELRETKDGPNLHTPVICLTANALSGAREMYMKEGFDNYLTKPIDPAKLEEMLVSYLPPSKVHYVMAQEPSDTSETEKQPGSEVTQDEPVSPLYREREGIHIPEAIEGMGSEEAFKEVLDIFYETIDETAEDIDEKYQSENWEYYTILVHALKSSARIVGALDLGEEAFEMEMAGKNRDLDYIHAHHQELLDHFVRFREILKDIYEDEDEPSEEKETADPDRIRDWYGQIRSAAEELDIDALDTIFDEINGYELPAEDASRMKELKHLADSFEYEELLEKLSE